MTLITGTDREIKNKIANSWQILFHLQIGNILK